MFVVNHFEDCFAAMDERQRVADFVAKFGQFADLAHQWEEAFNRADVKAESELFWELYKHALYYEYPL